MQLGRDVFRALAAIVWADGKVTSEEAEALVEAARASGLTGDDLATVEAATRGRVDLAEVGELALDGDERLFVYGIASWLTWVDGEVVASETAVLEQLGDKLGLTPAERDLAASASADVGGTEHGVLLLARAIREAAAEG